MTDTIERANQFSNEIRAKFGVRIFDYLITLSKEEARSFMYTMNQNLGIIAYDVEVAQDLGIDNLEEDYKRGFHHPSAD